MSITEFIIPGDILETRSDTRKLFEFLTDFKNFGSILPPDKADNFTYNGETCSFTIKGITPITILLRKKIPYSEIYYVSDGLGRFNFNLRVFFLNDGEKQACKIEMGGSLNPYILKLAKQPLEDLVNSMTRRLSELEI